MQCLAFKTSPWNKPSCAVGKERPSNEMGVSALSQVLNVIILHPLVCAFPPLTTKTKETPKLPRNTSSTLVKKNLFPVTIQSQPSQQYTPAELPRASGPPPLCELEFLEAHDARGDPDHSSRGYLSQTTTTELGLSNKELRAAAPGLLPWQPTSRNKGNPHALRALLCQNLLRKYLSSTIINRKYSDLFSVAGLQSFYTAGLQPTKAKTQNKQNKNKFPFPTTKATASICWRKIALFLFAFESLGFY